MASNKNNPTSTSVSGSVQTNISSTKGPTISSNTPTERPTHPTEKSDYRIIKDGWGNRLNFQYSHGLPITRGGFDEGKAILDAYRQVDRENLDCSKGCERYDSSDSGEESHDTYEHREDNQIHGSCEDYGDSEDQRNHEGHEDNESQGNGYGEDYGDYNSQEGGDHQDYDDFYSDYEGY